MEVVQVRGRAGTKWESNGVHISPHLALERLSTALVKEEWRRVHAYRSRGERLFGVLQNLLRPSDDLPAAPKVSPKDQGVVKPKSRKRKREQKEAQKRTWSMSGRFLVSTTIIPSTSALNAAEKGESRGWRYDALATAMLIDPPWLAGSSKGEYE